MEEKEKLRKERQKRRKYRLLILLLLMLGTGTMLATSTYAWFTSNKNVSVESLKVNIEAKNGIQISADATNWKSIVQKTDLIGARAAGGKYGTAVNQIPETLEPVSTTGIPETGKLPMYYGVVESDENTGNYVLTATKTVERDNNEDRGDNDLDPAKFIAFDLFFKVKEDIPVYLQAGSGVSAVTGEGEADTGIKNASRIAFIVEGNKPDGTALNEIQGLVGGTTSTIWEPNAGSHTAAGVAQARDVYNKTTTAGDTNDALSYFGVKAPITLDKKVLLNSEATEYFTEVTPGIKTNKGFDTNVALFTLTAGITKVRIYMWVEGQDVDCENSASGSDISFNVEFVAQDNT